MTAKVNSRDEDLIRNHMVRNHANFHSLDDPGLDQKMLFYEEYSERYFERYEREIMDAEYHLNRNFVLCGYASLNEFYEFLGLEPTELGEEVGWTIDDGIQWVDFEHRFVPAHNGMPDHYCIDMMFEPEKGYMEEWE